MPCRHSRLPCSRSRRCVLGAPAAHAAGTDWFFATTGNDSYVCNDSSTPCATVNAAIAQASSGDTINVADGSYDQNVVVDKGVALVGNGAGIDSIAVTDATGTVDISGFTVHSTSAALISVSDTVADTQITIHNNTLTGDSSVSPQAGSPSPATSRRSR